MANKRSSLFVKLLIDLFSGAFAAFSVTPIILAVDKAVVQNMSGQDSIISSLYSTLNEMVQSPMDFIQTKQFLWVFLVYSSTYISANSITTLCARLKINNIVPKLIGVSAVNIYCGILKDMAFARYFGKSNSDPVGQISKSIWLVRDILTICAGFIVPDLMTKVLSNMGLSKTKGEKISQMVCPVLFQLFLTPIHLLGYDFHNNPNIDLLTRLFNIITVYKEVIGARFLRMGGAFGLGGINNTMVKKNLNKIIG